MSQVYCWECENSYARDQVFDIPIFKRGYTVKWCFNCAMTQLAWSDYRLVNYLTGDPKFITYKKFRIPSIEDGSKIYSKFLEELELSFEAQFRKVQDEDDVWGEFHYIAQDTLYV